jgi:hypothetical protein
MLLANITKKFEIALCGLAHDRVTGDEIMRKLLTLGAATLCLLVVDWFTFHDFRELHTVKDYLTLLASIMVFFCFGNELTARAGRGA